MIKEITKILEKANEAEDCEYFDDGSFQVDMDTLQRIYTAGYKEGSATKPKTKSKLLHMPYDSKTHEERSQSD